MPFVIDPGIVGAIVVVGLVVAGVASLSTVLYVAFFGGMILMHVGGHGHRGHGAGGIDHGGRGDATPAVWTDGADDLSSRSSRSQLSGSGSAAEFDEGAPNDSMPPSDPGEHEFAYHVGMLRGRIIVEAAS